MDCRRKLLKSTWQDKALGMKVLIRDDLSNIDTLLGRAQIWSVGNVIRNPDTLLTNRLLYSKLVEVKCTKCIKATLKSSLNRFKIKTDTCKTILSDEVRSHTNRRGSQENKEIACCASLVLNP